MGYENPEDVIKRLCLLVEEVNRRVFQHAHAADCFCGHGGMWDAPSSPPSGWRFDDAALDYIVKAVRDCIETDEAFLAAAQEALGVAADRLDAVKDHILKQVRGAAGVGVVCDDGTPRSCTPGSKF